MKGKYSAAVVFLCSIALLMLAGLVFAQSLGPLSDDVIAIVTAAAEGEDIEPLLDELSRKYILVTPTSTPTPVPTKTPQCTLDYEFVADVTVPDYTQFDGGEAFEKVWRIENTGTCAWGKGYEWVFQEGDKMGPRSEIGVPSIAPGELADLKVAMTAPSSPGVYRGRWQMRSADGQPFGTTSVVAIEVREPPTPTSTPTTEPSVMADMHEPVIVGDWLMYVYRVNREPQVWYYEEPVDPENGVYAIVRLKVNNLTLDTVTMDKQLEFEVHDDQGRVFEFLKGQTADRAAHRHVPNHADVYFKMPPGVIDYPVLLTFDVAQDSEELWLDVYDRDRSEKASIHLAPCQSKEDRICEGKFIDVEPED